MSDHKQGNADTRPLEYDEKADKRVEKKPEGKQSPQQEHNDEDHG